MELISLVVLGVIVEAAVAQSAAVCETQSLQVVEGDDVTLRCHLRPPADASVFTVDWKRVDLNAVVHLYRHRKDDDGPQMQRYRGRTQLHRPGLSAGVLDLHVSSVRPSDSGQYRCHVPTLSTSCISTVTVVKQKDGSTASPRSTEEPKNPGDHLVTLTTLIVIICVLLAAVVVWRLVKHGPVENCSLRRQRPREETNLMQNGKATAEDQDTHISSLDREESAPPAGIKGIS